ncbi:MAG: DUF4115 domain-containing protein [Alphaproteobacteria bacterium]|nr:DUF4115 domain-containing protein [Alphaproteobacteria bacterium]
MPKPQEPALILPEPEPHPEPVAVLPEPEPESAPLHEPVVVIQEPEPKPAQRPEAKQKQNQRSDRIGDILRTERLKRGDDLYLIAEYLRIKPAFLIAMENSRYDEIPADAYVIGFLRTYANFLGVDGKEAVDRYRYEMAGRRKKPVLSMPTPVSEGRAPSGIIMVGATVVVLLIYALWYGFSSANRAVVNVPPPLPVAVQPLPAADANAAAGLTAPVASVPAAPAATIPAPTPTAAEPKPASSPPAPTASTPAIPPAAPGIVVSGELPAAKDNDLGKSAKESKAEAREAAKEAAKAEKKAEKEAETEKAQTNHVYGDPDAAARIVIRATQNSWVMVTDDSGKTLFDHVLKPGDSYKVPSQPGLSLTTGNGNGIVLSLDGKDLPKVASGAPHLVRNISLDPSHLAADH